MGATAARQARVTNPVFARIFPRLSQAMSAPPAADASFDAAAAIERAGFSIERLDRFLSPRPAPPCPSTSPARRQDLAASPLIRWNGPEIKPRSETGPGQG
jgi:hypothetical protein